MLIDSIGFRPLLFNNLNINNLKNKNTNCSGLPKDVFFSSRKQQGSTDKTKMQEKENLKLQKEIEKADVVGALYFCDYENVVSCLLEDNSVGMVSLGISIDKKEEKPVTVRIQNSEDHSDFYNYSADEFIDILNKAKDIHIQEYPEEEDNYNKLTDQLIEKIKS